MIVLEYILLILMLSVGTLSSYFDLKKGIVPNRLLLVFSLVGICLDIVYYGFLATDIAGLFFLNWGVASALGLVLFFTRSFAGGDCKLIISMALLYPAGMYLTYAGNPITLFFSTVIGIFCGYVYLLVVSIWKLLIGDNKLRKEDVYSYLKGYVAVYCSAIAYIVLFNLLMIFFATQGLIIWNWVILFVSCTLAWCVGRTQVLRKKAVLGIVIAADIILSLLLKVVPLALDPRNYLLTAILIICQISVKTNLYEVIPTESVRKGMILSTASSIMIRASSNDILPAFSSEDLSSRMTEEEAESVRRWGRKKAEAEITIVKKMPFAVFISLGFFIYYLIWRLAV